MIRGVLPSPHPHVNLTAMHNAQAVANEQRHKAWQKEWADYYADKLHRYQDKIWLVHHYAVQDAIDTIVAYNIAAKRATWLEYKYEHRMGQQVNIKV